MLGVEVEDFKRNFSKIQRNQDAHRIYQVGKHTSHPRYPFKSNVTWCTLNTRLPDNSSVADYHDGEGRACFAPKLASLLEARKIEMSRGRDGSGPGLIVHVGAFTARGADASGAYDHAEVAVQVDAAELSASSFGAGVGVVSVDSSGTGRRHDLFPSCVLVDPCQLVGKLTPPEEAVHYIVLCDSESFRTRLTSNFITISPKQS